VRADKCWGVYHGPDLYTCFTGIFLHDPTCMAALLDPSLFTFRKGAVRVETKGRCVGHTLLDYGLKKYVAIPLELMMRCHNLASADN